MQKFTRRIAAMCAVLALVSCSLKQHTPEPEPQPEPQPETVAFRASSQASWVKSTTTSSTLSDYHNDFGVWGIARKEGASDYILWSENGLTQVRKNTATDAPENEYIPVRPAYWVGGYTYNFIAIAPYTDSGVSNINVVHTEESTDDAPDAISFVCNVERKYEPSDPSTPKVYDFDLMGTVAETEVSQSSTQGAQSLTFWHLFSQLNIEVLFGKDPHGNQITGTVNEMELKNVDASASYEISFNDDKSLKVTCLSSRINSQKNLLFEESEDDTKWHVIANVIPQNIQDWELYLDFTVGGVEYEDFKVDLKIGDNNPADYLYNHRYNWTITIGSSLYVSFSASVAPWDDNNGSMYPADGDDDGEIKM